jgi:folate-binding protein YgfZ
MVADGRVWNRGEDVVIDTEPGFLGAVREYLEKHLISEEAELHAGADLAVVSVVGPLAERAAAAAGEALRSGSLVPPGVDLLVPRADLQAVLERLAGAGAALAGFETWERLRVEAGVPRYGRDMDEKTIPLEAGLQRAISYDKGCYVGQEVIARATFRGHMNRTLSGLLLGDTAAAPGTDLMREGKRVGWLTSVVKSPRLGQHVALGYVRREVEPGSRLILGEGPATATVQPLPFP